MLNNGNAICSLVLDVLLIREFRVVASALVITEGVVLLVLLLVLVVLVLPPPLVVLVDIGHY